MTSLRIGHRWIHAAITLGLLLVASTEALGKTRNGVLPGASPRDPLVIDAGTLDFFDREQKLVYSDRVLVTNGPSTLKASRLIIYLEDKKKTARGDNDRVKRVDAEGPVTLTSPDQTSTGDRVNFDKAKNRVFLSGNVTITEGDSVVQGDRATYDMTTGDASVESDPAQGRRIRTTFTSKKPR